MSLRPSSSTAAAIAHRRRQAVVVRGPFGWWIHVDGRFVRSKRVVLFLLVMFAVVVGRRRRRSELPSDVWWRYDDDDEPTAPPSPDEEATVAIVRFVVDDRPRNDDDDDGRRWRRWWWSNSDDSESDSESDDYVRRNLRTYAGLQGYAFAEERAGTENDHRDSSSSSYSSSLSFLRRRFPNAEWALSWRTDVADVLVVGPYVRVEDRARELSRRRSLFDDDGETTPPCRVVWRSDGGDDLVALRRLRAPRGDGDDDDDSCATTTLTLGDDDDVWDGWLRRVSPPLPSSRGSSSSSSSSRRRALREAAELSRAVPVPPLLPPVPPTADLGSLSPTRRARYEAVRRALRRAWRGYADTAHRGRSLARLLLRPRALADDARPVSRTGSDWLHHAATLHDALDALWLAGLEEEYEEARRWIVEGAADTLASSLFPTKTFEYSLRVVGGLLGAFSVSGDARLLSRARDAADALLASPFAASPTALPRPYDVLFPTRASSRRRRRRWWWSWSSSSWTRLAHELVARAYRCLRDRYTEEHRINSLAGVGSFSLEFAFSSAALGDDVYREAADAIFRRVADRRRDDGTVPRAWNVLTGEPAPPFVAGLGSGSDSFYEYALKVPLAACPRADDGRLACERVGGVPDEMRALYRDVARGPLRTRHVRASPTGDPEVAYPVEAGNLYHHLLCFLPGTLALGASVGAAGSDDHDDDDDDDLALAKRLLRGCRELHRGSPTGLGPEEVDVGALDGEGRPSRTAVRDPAYRLRPEYVESLFVLHRLTKNDDDDDDRYYQDAGWEVFRALETYCRVDADGYAGLLDVYADSDERRLDDDQPSYFLAETLKYLLLLFGPDDRLPLDEFVLTTEAHPLRIATVRGDADGVVRVLPYHLRSEAELPAPPILVLVAVILVGTCAAVIVLSVRRLRRRRRRAGRKRERDKTS